MFNNGIHDIIFRNTFTGEIKRRTKEVTVQGPSREPSSGVTAGPFAHAHDFTVINPIMKEITRIETQNIYNNGPKEEPPLSPLRSNIPCTSRNFVGQETYLEKLRECFKPDSIAERKIFILYGMGGIGKTQICLKLIDEIAFQFTNVLWIDATSEDTVLQSLKEIFKKLSLPGTAASSFSSAAALNKISGLESDWIMIYDNADGAPELVEKYLPPGNKGNILITSRNPAHRRLASYETSMEVSEMANESAIDLLLKTSGSEMHSPGKRELAQMIVNELNHHPLAIDMAGAYIMQTRCPIQDFLQIYNNYRPKILNNERFKGASAYNKTVYKTWEMSFQAISKMHDNTEDKEKADVAKYSMALITMSAFFHHENISYSIFRGAAENYSMNVEDESDTPAYRNIIDKSILNINEDGEWDQWLFNESISLLYSFSLIKDSSSPKVFNVHPLLQSCCQDRLTNAQKEMWILNSRFILIASVPEGSLDKYIYMSSLLPHISKNVECSKLFNGKKYFHDLHQQLSNILHHNGKYNLEEKYRLDTVYFFLQKRGSADKDVINISKELEICYKMISDKNDLNDTEHHFLNSIMSLAMCYYEQGKWTKAEQLEVLVLNIRERILGKEHPDTLISMNNLASTYHNLGKYAEAEKLQNQVVNIYERILGKEHPDTLRSMNNLANTYSDQGKYADAEHLLIQVLKMRESILGKEHPGTLLSMNNLASTYYRVQEKYTEAEQLQIQVLNICKKIIGKDHPGTLLSMNSLASTYRDQGKYADAEQLQTQVLKMREIVLGKEHPDTLSTMNNLANTYCEQGKFADAEQLQIQVLKLRERILGKEHPDTLSSMNNLASIYSNLENYVDAEKLETQALKMRESILGKEHPDTLQSMSNLATTYWEQGRYAEAEKLHIQILNIQETISGREHPSTMTA